VLYGASTRAELLHGIWGESSKANLEYFKVALRKLRMAFSDHSSITFEPILFEDGVYKLHPRLQIQCSAADLLNTQDNFPTDPEKLEWLFSSYRGQFLAGIESKWVQELQRVLLELAVQIGERWGQHLITTDKYKAVRIFRRVLEFDPLSEIAKSAA
jgi:LuxR family transcriptional regulator, maltose regulon positive regulatory protein